MRRSVLRPCVLATLIVGLAAMAATGALAAPRVQMDASGTVPVAATNLTDELDCIPGTFTTRIIDLRMAPDRRSVVGFNHESKFGRQYMNIDRAGQQVSAALQQMLRPGATVTVTARGCGARAGVEYLEAVSVSGGTPRNTAPPAGGVAIAPLGQGPLSQAPLTQAPAAAPSRIQPLSQPALPAAQQARVSGEVGYPSEGVPNGMAVCAETVDGASIYCTDQLIRIAAPVSRTSYQLSVPPGLYRIFARLTDPSTFTTDVNGDYRAYFSAFVVCGNHASCPSHEPLAVALQAGQSRRDIDVGDWYLPRGR